MSHTARPKLVEDHAFYHLCQFREVLRLQFDKVCLAKRDVVPPPDLAPEQQLCPRRL